MRPEAQAFRSPTSLATLEVWMGMGAMIMLGTLFGLIVLIFALVLRFDPGARAPSKRRGPGDV